MQYGDYLFEREGSWVKCTTDIQVLLGNMMVVIDAFTRATFRETSRKECPDGILGSSTLR